MAPAACPPSPGLCPAAPPHPSCSMGSASVPVLDLGLSLPLVLQVSGGLQGLSQRHGLGLVSPLGWGAWASLGSYWPLCRSWAGQGVTSIHGVVWSHLVSLLTVMEEKR